MNRALWRKAVSDAWLQLVISSALMILFCWVFVWFVSLFPVGAWRLFLSYLPDLFQPFLGVPVAKLATPVGQISILFVHVVTNIICVGWAVGRGSDPITGELSRGTMDLILSLPVRRVEVMIPPAVVAAAGSAVLAASILAGLAVALAFIKLEGPVTTKEFLPGAINLAAMTFCLTSITTLISSLSRDRWRTIAGGIAVLAVSFVIKMVARGLVARGLPYGWLNYLSFLSAFEPQELVLVPGAPALRYDLALLGVGLACYLAAAVVFSRRDIPAAR